jgi:hypothetical protein
VRSTEQSRTMAGEYRRARKVRAGVSRRKGPHTSILTPHHRSSKNRAHKTRKKSYPRLSASPNASARRVGRTSSAM